MKLKPETAVEGNDQFLTLQLGSKTRSATPKDAYILHAMLQGMRDENAFLQLVMRVEQIDEIEAGFRMAMFVEDYGEFLAVETLPHNPFSPL